jgi:RimJ/RimL family protein N-acetyltransferase
MQLRPLRDSALQDLHALYDDRDLMRFITGAPRTLAQTTSRLSAHLDDHRRHGFELCAVLVKDGDEMIRRCGLEPNVAPSGLEGDLAWMFHRRYWGRGLGTEVARALIHYGLATLRLSRVFAIADHRNTSSIAIMEKVGMTLAGTTVRGVEYEVTP